MEILTIDNHSPEMQAFIDLPWQIYPNQYPWVPSLKTSVQNELSHHNPFFRHGSAQAFVCKKNGQAVGRIVASVDRNRPDSEVGYFGYWELQHDQEVANELLQTAENWLKQQGCTTVQGPVNLSIYHAYRLQTAGFDSPPFLGEPRSPAYYLDLLQQAGYHKHAGWHSWDIPAAILPMMESYMQQQVEAHEEPENAFFTCYFNIDDFEHEMKRLRPLAMETFAQNFGFSPLDETEFIQVYGALKSVIQLAPELFGYISPNHQEIAGFAYGYLDLAPAFQQMNGDATQMHHLLSSQPNTIVFHTFGIPEKYRKSTVSYRIFRQAFQHARKHKVKTVIGALAKEGRTAYSQLGEPSRSYAVFEKRI